MPTKSDFEAAAAKFEMAAQQIGDLMTAAEAAGPSRILRGGSLGEQVPDRIAQASSLAAQCGARIQDAAQTCLERAAIIADYEIRLDIYDQAYGHYQLAARRWSSRYNTWFLDETGLKIHPGPSPRPPAKPTPPPDWADVRRP